MKAPRKLSSSPASPHFNKVACSAVDKVFCDGVLVPECVFYDMDAGKARGKHRGNWLPIVEGVITVKMKDWSK